MDAAARGTGNAPLLAVDNVTLQYKTEQHLVTATYRVGFEVFAGERYVVLGPSGCGKSTILKAVAGFMQPVEGQIRLNGKQIKQPGSDRMMVFQEFDQLLPWKTVLGNVLFPLLVNRRMPRAEATAHALGRHEAARRDRARARDGACSAADGRAVRCAGCAHAPQDAGGAESAV